MGRKHITPILQPDDLTCGPSALKIALAILGKKKSLNSLIDLCQTNRNGTSTQHLIKAVNKIGLSVLALEYATLHHLQSALRYPPNKIRAVMVSYLYDLDDNDEPHPESGHWAVVASYLSSTSRIVLLDSATGQKKSYLWSQFRERWVDYDLKRKKVGKNGSFKLVKNWQRQAMIVIAKDKNHLPKFKINSAQLYLPSVS